MLGAEGSEKVLSMTPTLRIALTLTLEFKSKPISNPNPNYKPNPNPSPNANPDPNPNLLGAITRSVLRSYTQLEAILDSVPAVTA